VPQDKIASLDFLTSALRSLVSIFLNCIYLFFKWWLPLVDVCPNFFVRRSQVELDLASSSSFYYPIYLMANVIYFVMFMSVLMSQNLLSSNLCLIYNIKSRDLFHALLVCGPSSSINWLPLWIMTIYILSWKTSWILILVQLLPLFLKDLVLSQIITTTFLNIDHTLKIVARTNKTVASSLGRGLGTFFEVWYMPPWPIFCGHGFWP